MLALAVWLLTGRQNAVELPFESVTGAPRAMLVLMAVLLVLGGTMSIRLVTSGPGLLPWEPPGVEGLGQALLEETPLSVFAGRRLLWQEGLVSTSHDSLLYGAPVYALWLAFGPSLWAMRAVALVWALVAVLGCYLLVRELAGSCMGLLAASLLSANALLFYFAQSGVALSATLAALLGAAWLVVRQISQTPRSPWEGAIAGFCCAAATLTYACARPVVLALLACAAVWLAQRWRLLKPRHILGVAVFCAVLAGFVGTQAAGGRLRVFLSGGGEQILNMLAHPDYASEYLGYRPDDENLSVEEGARVTLGVLSNTVPEYLRILTPLVRFEELAASPLRPDPHLLPFLPVPLVPFALLGLFRAARSWRQVGPMLMLAWFGAGSVAALLSTRADVHRMWVLTVPLVFWAADGLRVLWRTMAAAGWRRHARRVALAGLLVPLAAAVVVYSFPAHIAHSRIADGVIAEMERIPGPVAFGGAFDDCGWGVVHLYLLRRFVDRAEHAEPRLPEWVLQPLRLDPPPYQALAELRRRVSRATVVLAPADAFSSAAQSLATLGYAVSPQGEGRSRIWIMERSARQPVLSGEALQGPELILSSLAPLETSFEFEPPRITAPEVEESVSSGRAERHRGVGMHAPSRMTFAVPVTAGFFKVRVGPDHPVVGCTHSWVMASVLADDTAVLFEKELLLGGGPPLTVAVPVAGRQRLTLEVTEGGDGRNCDRVFWADPVFILQPPHPNTPAPDP